MVGLARKGVYRLLILMGPAGSWVVSVLADDSYAYFDALNNHSTFFAIQFRAHTLARWIVRGSNCLELLFVLYHFVLYCCITIKGF
jgi:hypothetical protein